MPREYFLLSPDLRWVSFAYFYENTNSNLSAFIQTEIAHQRWERFSDVKLTPKIHGAAEAFSPDSKSVAIVNYSSDGDKEGTAEFWDLESNTRLQTWHDLSIKTLTYSPDGRWIATGRSDAALWNTGTGKKVKELPTKARGVYGVTRLAFRRDSSLLAVLTSTYIQLWDVATGQAGRVLHVPGVQFYDVVFTDDAQHLISSNNPGMYIWDVATGRQLGKPLKQTEGDLALSPDGRWLAVVSDHDLTLWAAAK